MRNKYPCIECCTGWGDGDGNSCRDTCKKLATYKKNTLRSNTYFVSWIVPNTTPLNIGNATFETQSTGVQLVKDGINLIQSKIPDAIILSISKLD